MTITTRDLFSGADFLRAVAAKLIRVQTHPTLPLTILNYTDAAMWTPGAWDNPAVRHCRGLITTGSDSTIVARPWEKFFNYGQAEAARLSLEAQVEVTDKIDGSLGIIYPTPDGPAVATRGSFTSEQAIHATQVLREKYPHFMLPDGFTPLVEIVYPANRIVLDYQGQDDLILLGGRMIDTGHAHGPQQAKYILNWEGPVAETFTYPTLAAALEAKPRKNAEGLVVRKCSVEQVMVKIKQADYVELHRIVTGLSEKTVWQAILDDKNPEDLLDGLPDELHPWVHEVWDRIADAALADVAFAAEVRERVLDTVGDDADRGEFAREVTRALDAPIKSYVFMLHDGRDPYLAAVKNHKPTGDTRPVHHSEDVA